jgi:hypothetical protein
MYPVVTQQPVAYLICARSLRTPRSVHRYRHQVVIGEEFFLFSVVKSFSFKKKKLFSHHYLQQDITCARSLALKKREKDFIQFNKRKHSSPMTTATQRALVTSRDDMI